MFHRSIAKAGKATRGPSVAGRHVSLEEDGITPGGSVAESGRPFSWFPILDLGVVEPR